MQKNASKSGNSSKFKKIEVNQGIRGKSRNSRKIRRIKKNIRILEDFKGFGSISRVSVS